MPYCLQNRNGGPTSKGAGRDKFYAALILVHGNYFDAASMRKIIPSFFYLRVAKAVLLGERLSQPLIRRIIYNIAVFFINFQQI